MKGGERYLKHKFNIGDHIVSSKPKLICPDFIVIDLWKESYLLKSKNYDIDLSFSYIDKIYELEQDYILDKKLECLNEEVAL